MVNYELKYKKYKNKYINLKNIGGSINELDYPIYIIQSNLFESVNNMIINYADPIFGLEIEICIDSIENSFLSKAKGVDKKLLHIDSIYTHNIKMKLLKLITIPDIERKIFGYALDHATLSNMQIARDDSCKCLNNLEPIELISPALRLKGMQEYIRLLTTEIYSYGNNKPLISLENNISNMVSDRDPFYCGVHIHWSSSKYYYDYIYESGKINYDKLYFFCFSFLKQIQYDHDMLNSPNLSKRYSYNVYTNNKVNDIRTIKYKDNKKTQKIIDLDLNEYPSFNKIKTSLAIKDGDIENYEAIINSILGDQGPESKHIIKIYENLFNEFHVEFRIWALDTLFLDEKNKQMKYKDNKEYIDSFIKEINQMVDFTNNYMINFLNNTNKIYNEFYSKVPFIPKEEKLINYDIIYKTMQKTQQQEKKGTTPPDDGWTVV